MPIPGFACAQPGLRSLPSYYRLTRLLIIGEIETLSKDARFAKTFAETACDLALDSLRHRKLPITRQKTLTVGISRYRTPLYHPPPIWGGSQNYFGRRCAQTARPREQVYRSNSAFAYSLPAFADKT
jgi:hypothetical protein